MHQWLKQGKLTKVTKRVREVARQFHDLAGQKETLTKDLETVRRICELISKFREISLEDKTFSMNKKIDLQVKQMLEQAKKEPWREEELKFKALRIIPFRRSAHQVLTDKSFVNNLFCVDFCHALLSILKAKKVPGRLVQVFGHHGATTAGIEFFLAGKWHHIKFNETKKAKTPEILNGLYSQKDYHISIRGIDLQDVGLKSLTAQDEASEIERVVRAEVLARKIEKKHGMQAVIRGNNWRGNTLKLA